MDSKTQKKTGEKKVEEAGKQMTEAWEGAMECWRKTGEAQQEIFKKWSSGWAAGWQTNTEIPDALAKGFSEMQQTWSGGFEEAISKGREIVETQSKGVVTAMESALEMAKTGCLEEFDKAAELQRSSLKACEEAAKVQLEGFQSAAKMWGGLLSSMAKKPSA